LVAVDAVVGIDVELIREVRIFAWSRRHNAIGWANIDAGSIDAITAESRDDEGHD
jgi:hypothetical protein